MSTELSTREQAVARYTDTTWDSVEYALQDNDLAWDVERSPVYNDYGPIKGVTSLVRSDTKQCLGTATDRYQIVQNRDVASLMDLTGCTSYNAVNLGGKANRILLIGRVERREVGSGDMVDSYINMMFGHDGKTSVSLFPSTFRAMCQNMAPGLIRKAKEEGSFFTFKHIGDVSARLDQLTDALTKYRATTNEYFNAVDRLAGTYISSVELREFYTTTYNTLFRPDQDDLMAVAARDMAIKQWSETLAQEGSDLNTPDNYWLAFNSVTKNLQSMTPSRGRKPSLESKVASLVDGKDAAATNDVFNIALQMA